MSEKEYEIHQCPSLEDNSKHVIYSRREGYLSEDSWTLIIQRNATEEDLQENHYLDQEGDTIWQTILAISYCPFCGEQLQPPEKCGGEFKHIDYSGWSCKVM